MKILIKILLLLLLQDLNAVHAQSSKIDSLNNLISKSVSDTGRINLLIEKGELLSAVNIDSSILLTQQILQDAKRINYYKGQVGARHILVRNYSLKGDFKTAKENLVFLEQLVKTSGDSIEYAKLYGSSGIMHGIRSAYDSAIYFLKKAVGIIERNNYIPELIKYYGELGSDYQQQSNYTEALKYQQAALKLSEENKDEVNQAYVLVNMATTYMDMGDTSKSDQTYKNSIKIAERNGLRNVEVYASSNLSSNAISENKWVDAYEYGMKAAALGGAMGDQGIQAASLSKAARALAGMNSFTKATQIARQAIVIADSSAQQFVISQAYSAMGTILYFQKRYKEAIPFYEKILTVNTEDYYDEFTGTMYSELAECYQKTGNTAKALAAFKKYDEIKDSTRSRENIQKATELAMNYEFDKKQAIAKAEQDKKNAESQRIRSQQLSTIIILGIIVLAVVIIAVIQFRSKRHKEHANIALQQQKEKVESTLQELKSTQALLIQKEKMASLGELTAGIAHEIQNPLNFVNNFSEINTELIDELEEEADKGNIEEVKAIATDIKENSQKIIHHGKRADSIVKGMLQHSRVSTGKKELTDINALVDECLRLSYHGFRAKDKEFNATIETGYDESIGKINIVPQDISRVLLNLLNNAFYAVDEKKRQLNGMYEPVVSVCTKKLDGKVEIHVKDNGNGIPQNIIDKIFQPFFTTKPTGQGTGLGLSLSYDIIKAHGGDIKGDSKEGGETEFLICLLVNS